MLDVQLVVLAKAPVAGRSKTRLTPPLSPQEAAEVARAALLDTLDAVAAVDVRRRVLVLDGDAADLVPPGFTVVPQVGGGLDARLAGAFAAIDPARSGPALLIGMDTPQVTPALLVASAEALLEHDAVLGHAQDGGWWAVGLHRSDPQLFLGVPMSADDTGAHQEQRLRDRGLSPYLLPTLRDIDHAADLEAVAALMPAGTRLPALAERLLHPVLVEGAEGA